MDGIEPITVEEAIAWLEGQTGEKASPAPELETVSLEEAVKALEGGDS